jgi:hypothetical protein
MSPEAAAVEVTSSAPFEVRFRPTRSEYAAGLVSWLPWPNLCFVVGAIAYVRFVQEALQAPDLRSLARVALLPIAAVVVELAYRATRGGVTIRLDAAGLVASWRGQDRRWPWAAIRVRETDRGYLLRGSLAAGLLVPRRVLDVTSRASLLAWLEVRQVPRFRPGRILGPVILAVCGLLLFVTVYNLMQTAAGSSGRVTLVSAPRSEYDGAAALTMLLRHAGRPVSLDELQGEVAPDGTAVAQKMIEAAGRRGVTLRGYLASDARDIATLTLPCIAHLREAAGLGQTRLPQANERGRFVVLERADAGRVTYVDPVARRRIEATMARFLEHFSGVVLVPAEPR